MSKIFSDSDIKKLFRKIETPEYNAVDDVMRKIKTRSAIPRKKHAIVTAAAVVSIIILLTGAAGYFIDYKSIDFFGNETIQRIFRGKDMRERTLSDPRSEEQRLFENEFFNGENGGIVWEGIFDSLETNIGTNIVPYTRRIDDFTELENYLSGSIFSLPAYIPAEYEFSHAEIEHFLSEDDLKRSRLIYSEEKFGVLYEKYTFNEIDAGKIKRIFIYYKKGENENFYIHCYLGDSVVKIGGPAEMKSEVLTLPNAEKSIFTSYSFVDFGKETTQSTVHLSSDIVPVKTLYPHILNESVYKRAVDGNNMDKYSETHSAILYHIDSYYLSRDEIIKIAGSIDLLK